MGTYAPGLASLNGPQGEFKQLVRSFRRWQLYKLQRLFYESHYPLGMHFRFRNRRRSQVAPVS